LNWDQLDWQILDRLREQFLRGAPGDYWRSPADLANYDFTFAQRIGWKWDAVLAELDRLGWRPPPGPVLDWGCGSGIAGRRVSEHFGLTPRRVFDRSALAMEFAGGERWRGEPPGVLVLSHVLNELREPPAIIEQAEAVLWVEPGTFADSRALIAAREKLRDQFHIVAPCTHRAPCGITGSDWCHFFAEPPKGTLADPNWVRFAQRAGIDLRSLPYSYLVLDRRPVAHDGARVIGEPRRYKGYAKVLLCDATGVRDTMIQKRDRPLKTIRSGAILTLP
jgi:hypothetical protein